MDDITLIQSDQEAHGAKKHTVLYWFTISPPVTDSGGATVVVQPSSSLPGSIAPLVDAAGKTALDAGEAGFEIQRYYQTEGETRNALANRLLADHAARETWWVQDQRARYADRGLGVSAA